MRRTIWVALAAWSAHGQTALSLNDAVRTALRGNPTIAAAGAAERGAERRVAAARGARLPKVNYSESWTRSDNPVFVFSSLLTQRRFTEENFQVGALNRPGFANQFQSTLSADQVLYDGGQTARAGQTAALARESAGEDSRLARLQTIAAVARAYYDVALGIEQLKSAEQALRSAEADLRRAESVRSAGMSTDADVLSIRVHVAAVEEQRIRRRAELEVARAALNDALGLPLDTEHTLTSALARAVGPERSLADYEAQAIANRPEARQAKLATTMARTQSADARSAMLPEVTAHAGFEADRGRFYEQGGGNWLVTVGVRWNLFNGGSDRARVEESEFAERRRVAEGARTESAIRLQVRRAWAETRSAEQRIEAAQASVAEAEESLRITKNRYDSGMSNVTDLLRTESAVMETRTRYLAAVHDQRIAATMLEAAAGTLNEDAEVLR
jgi:outer membrane protein